MRIDLPSNQIDSQIDSHLILNGRTKMRIENRFFLTVQRGLKFSQSVSQSISQPVHQMRIDLGLRQIDSQIDSHLILDGRIEIGIDNRFVLDCSKGSGVRRIA